MCTSEHRHTNLQPLSSYLLKILTLFSYSISTAHSAPWTEIWFQYIYSSYFLEIALHSSQHIIWYSNMQRLLGKIKCFYQDKKITTLNFKPSNLISFSDRRERSLLKPSSESAVHAAQMKCCKCRKAYTRKIVLRLPIKT